MTDIQALRESLELRQEIAQQFSAQFPALLANPDLIYFDNASTSLRPQVVLEQFIAGYNLPGNLERSLINNELGSLVKDGNASLQAYLEPHSAIESKSELSLVNRLTFTENTTSAVNLLALTLKEYWLAQKPEPNTDYYILVGTSNHHANILPWLKLSQECPNFKIVNIPLQGNMDWDLEFLRNFLKEHATTTLLISVNTVDNVSGFLHPIAELRKILTTLAPNTWLCLDNAQGSAFNREYLTKAQLTKQGWGADFLVGSLHKMFGITGVGYLLISPRIAALANNTSQTNSNNLSISELFSQFVTNNAKAITNTPTLVTKNVSAIAKPSSTTSQNTPLHLNIPIANNCLKHQWVGGGFVQNIDLTSCSYQLKINNPFTQAGTPNTNNLLTVAKHIQWLRDLPTQELYNYTHDLQRYFIAQLATLPKVVNLQKSNNLAQDLSNSKSPIIILPSYGHHLALTISDGLDLDLGTFLAQKQIITRVGKHCAYPYYKTIGIDSTIRFSLAPYNTLEQVDKTIALIKEFIAQEL